MNLHWIKYNAVSLIYSIIVTFSQQSEISISTMRKQVSCRIVQILLLICQHIEEFFKHRQLSKQNISISVDTEKNSTTCCLKIMKFPKCTIRKKPSIPNQDLKLSLSGAESHLCWLLISLRLIVMNVIEPNPTRYCNGASDRTYCLKVVQKDFCAKKKPI